MHRRTDIENKVLDNEIDFSTGHILYWTEEKRAQYIDVQYDICHATYHTLNPNDGKSCLGCEDCLYNFVKEEHTREFLKILIEEGRLTKAQLLIYTLDGKLNK